MALQLFLTAAFSASEHAKSELIAYEFFEQVCLGAVGVREDVKSMSAMSMSAEPAPPIVKQHVPSMHLRLPVIICRLSCCLRSPFQTALLSAQPCPALLARCTAAIASLQSRAAPSSTKQQATLQSCCARQTSAGQSLHARTSTGR